MKSKVMLSFILLNFLLVPNLFGNEKSPYFALSFGTYNPAEMYPTDVVVDSQKYIYILDELNRKVHKRDAKNNVLMEFGSKGMGDGQFRFPRGIALDSEGKIYVTDCLANRVQKFNIDGSFITKWGQEGSGVGDLSYPTGIAISASGLVYVSDRHNLRIQVFDTNGSFLFMFGEDSPLLVPDYIALDSNNNVWVTDITSQVIKYDENGNYILSFGSGGTSPGQFLTPTGIAIDADDYVYVYDRWNFRIQKFDQNGNFVSMWGEAGNGDGQLHGLGLAADADSNIYIADYWNYRVQKFDSTGQFLYKWSGTVTGDAEFGYVHDLIVNHLGDVYVVDRYDQKVRVFDDAGSFLFKWGFRGKREAGFNFPRAIAVDSENNVYITNDNHINVFDANGDYLYYWGVGRLGAYWVGPLGITSDLNDQIFFTTTQHDVVKTDRYGNSLKIWGTYGANDGQFNHPTGIATDSAGNVYVSDSGNYRIQKFTNDGDFLLSWGSYGEGDGQFMLPWGLAVDPEDYVYVVDQRKNEVQKFDSSGNFLTKWGQPGSGDGEFDRPLYIAIDDSGKNIYVTDRYNGRVQKFTYEPVSLSLSPDISTVPRGGVLNLQATMTNKTSKYRVFWFVTNVTLPNGNLYPRYPEPLYGPIETTLAPGATVTHHIAHDISTGAPLGVYVYNGYIAKSRWNVWSEDHFEFTVTASARE